MLPLFSAFLSLFLLLTSSLQSSDIPPNRLFAEDYRLGRDISRLQGSDDSTRELNGWERLREKVPSLRSLIISEYEQNIFGLLHAPSNFVLDVLVHLLVTREMDSRHPLQIRVMSYALLYIGIGFFHGITSRYCFQPTSPASNLSKIATLFSLVLVVWGSIMSDFTQEAAVLEYLEYCDLFSSAAGIIISVLFSGKAIYDLLLVSLLEK